jgi:hypothetical protein
LFILLSNFSKFCPSFKMSSKPQFFQVAFHSFQKKLLSQISHCMLSPVL